MYDFHNSTDTLKFWTEKWAINKTFLFFIRLWWNLVKLWYPCVHVLQLHQVPSKSDEKQKSFINSTFNGCVVHLGSVKGQVDSACQKMKICFFNSDKYSIKKGVTNNAFLLVTIHLSSCLLFCHHAKLGIFCYIKCVAKKWWYFFVTYLWLSNLINLVLARFALHRHHLSKVFE